MNGQNVNDVSEIDHANKWDPRLNNKISYVSWAPIARAKGLLLKILPSWNLLIGFLLILWVHWGQEVFRGCFEEEFHSLPLYRFQ